MYFYLKGFNYSDTYFSGSAIDVFTQKVSFKVILLPRLLLLLIFTGINVFRNNDLFLLIENIFFQKHIHQIFRTLEKLLLIFCYLKK